MSENHGREFWQSLEEFADSEALQEVIEREFPEQASEWTNPVTRRRFLSIMGASIAFAGLNGCSAPPREKILPYIKQPEQLVPGKPMFYATAMTLNGIATGLLVESHMGRPTKMEGNPDHPASLGATDIYNQADILSMYDPDRSQLIRYRGRPSTWTAAAEALRKVYEDAKKKQGEGLHILTGTVTSPTLNRQLTGLLNELPKAEWHQYDPARSDETIEGANLAFGKAVSPIYDFSKADVVVALDGDFLDPGPGHLRYTNQFMSRRRVRENAASPTMNRLYAIESTPNCTGAKADHRLAMPASEVLAVARQLAHAVGTQFGDVEGPHKKWVEAVARDLKAEGRKGKTIIVAGATQPAVVHALAHAMNEALGNVGETVHYIPSVEAKPENQTKSLERLTLAMDSGGVDALLILGGNPVYNAPADLKFAAALNKAKLRFHLSQYEDETSQQCHWHLPASHFLETWSDARAFDGTLSIVQPLIAPLYKTTKSAHEILAQLSSNPSLSAYNLVQQTHQELRKAQGMADGFNNYWRKALHDGLIANSAFEKSDVTLNNEAISQALNEAPKSEGEWEIVFRPDPTIFDGQFANNGWLQELPKPLTKLTWDNVAMISPSSAKKLGIDFELEEAARKPFLVELELAEREKVRAPVWVQPGHPDGAVSVFLGYGRTIAGRVGKDQGYDAYQLRSSEHLWNEAGLKITVTDDRHELACTQKHQVMEGRHLVREGSLEEFSKDKKSIVAKGEHGHGTHGGPHSLSLYEPYEYNGNKWGMAIDLTACTGCSSCIVACQSENNIPVVGKEQVQVGREMHWIRLDRYYQGKPEEPEVHFQPVPCMHCENAPCELVCPVEATVHSDEGLNDMVYNRCVGTRYCSNNCPYKVRRFNFLQYADFETKSLKPMRNPDVTVRSRGVMEKCTYCVQRINHARIDAEKENRPIADGEVLTACQSACPANAILFGNLNDVNSKVAKAKASPLNYGLLTELNTVPRTTYLASVKNINPDPDLHSEESRES